MTVQNVALAATSLALVFAVVGCGTADSSPVSFHRTERCLRHSGAAIDTTGNYTAPQPNAASITVTNIGPTGAEADIVFGHDAKAGSRIFRDWSRLSKSTDGLHRDANVVWLWTYGDPGVAAADLLSTCLLDAS